MEERKGAVEASTASVTNGEAVIRAAAELATPHSTPSMRSTARSSSDARERTNSSRTSYNETVIDAGLSSRMCPTSSSKGKAKVLIVSNETASVSETDEESPDTRSPGQMEFDQYLHFVQLIEEKFENLLTFSERTAYLYDFREHLWPFERSKFQWAYAMLLSRNPHEIPEDRRWDRCRMMEEMSTQFSGTDDPTQLSFSIRARQQRFFGGWQWPTGTSGAEFSLDVGPKEEVRRMIVQPPAGESWTSLMRAQELTEPVTFCEKFPSRWPKYDIPSVSGVLSMTQEAARSISWPFS